MSKHIDHRFGIMSYEQYLIDNEEKKFNKICITDIINADTTIATSGEEKYFKTCSEILIMGNEAYKMMGIDHLIHVYVHTYKSFMAVANDDMSDEDFFNLMKVNHEQYELITASRTDIGGVSRFVVAFGDNLINRVCSALYVHKDLQNNFIIENNEFEQLESQAKTDADMFEMLNYAINNDKVIPYYQGIRDNQTGEIAKYEALMRIQDKQGKIHTPWSFLDASKRLKLYLTLSKKMIDKALSDFAEKQSNLSINVSLFDIQSKDFRDWFLKRAMEHPDTTKITIEFVETENYNNNAELIAFLEDARSVGCKIAVDDFGVGFATYSSIITLKPDIIKIDGDIIKNLVTNEDSVIILESIKYMADLIGSKTVAEFVENESIQEIVVKYNIDYSQGYLYAKPEPADALNIK